MAELQMQSSNDGAIMFAVIATLITAGPLFGLMGLSMFATTTLLVLTGPLILLFSPVLVPAALFFAFVLTSFSAAVMLSFVGYRALKWAVYGAGGLMPESIVGGDLKQKALTGYGYNKVF